MKRRLPILLAATFALSSCGGEELPPGAEFLRYLQRDADVLVYVGDLLPHLQAALESDALMRFLQDMPLLPGTRPDPAHLRLQLQAIRDYVPARACLSIPREGMVALGAVWRALVAGARCEQAQLTRGAGLRVAQEEFAAAVADLGGARASLYVGFRDERTAEMLFDQLLDLRPLWVMNPALEVEEKLDALELRVRPGSFAERPMFYDVLTQFGLVASRDDPGVELIREAVSPLNARIVVELVGDGLVLTLGTSGGGDSTKLTGLWRHHPAPAAYLQWDLGAVQGALQEDFPGQPLETRVLGRYARTAPVTGSLRLDLDGQSLFLIAEHDPTTTRFLPSPLPPEVTERLDIHAESGTIGDRTRSELRISFRR